MAQLDRRNVVTACNSHHANETRCFACTTHVLDHGGMVYSFGLSFRGGWTPHLLGLLPIHVLCTSVNMKSLAFLLLFAQSSFQLPTAQDSSPKLVSRYHVESPYVVDLQTPYNRRLGRRQYNTNGTNLTTSGGGYVVDNFSGGKYLLPLTVAGETVNVEIDTGSAG